MFATLGRRVYRRRRQVLLVWLVLLIPGGMLGSRVASRLTAVMPNNPSLESTQVQQQLRALGGDGDQLVAIVNGVSPQDPAVRAEVVAAAHDVRAMPGVAAALDPYTTPVPALVAKDGGAEMVVVTLTPGLGQSRVHHVVKAVSGRLRKIQAGTVKVGGNALLAAEFQSSAQRDLQKGERIAFPIAFAVMVGVFGGLLLAAIPLVIAAMAVAGSLLLLLIVSGFTDVSTFAINIITSLGVGFGIDYGLIVVSRFREERGEGADVAQAVERTVATAGMTVAFSALTVAGSLIGLFAFGEPILRSFAIAGILVVLFAMAASVTLLPALLGILGPRIKPGPIRLTDNGHFYRQSRWVQRHALPTVVIVGGVLIALAAPFSHARFQVSDSRSLPRTSETRGVGTVLAERFPALGADPIVVLADSPATSPAVTAFRQRLSSLAGVVAVTMRPVAPSASVTVLDAVPTGNSQGATAQRLVHTIRGIHDTGFRVRVGGTAAHLVDFKRSVVNRLPLAVGLIVIATLGLLFLMTGSLVVPLKAIVMNMLSLGASFGALVWVFQEGHLSGLLGFDSVGSLDLFGPVLVFIFAFGLSMDYEVFLLSRIKESYEETMDNDTAVAIGLQRSGRIITSAAVLIVVVFAGFGAGEVLIIKQFGLGMALAVIVDATIVRSLLVPATMKLLGAWNWWAPAPLQRLHKRIGLHERELPALTTVRTDPATADPQAARV